MEKIRSFLYCFFAVLFTAALMPSCTEDGKEGEEGKPASVVTVENCRWYIDGVDTGKPACDSPGSVVTIGDNGNWWIDNEDTGVPAQGESGSAASGVTIGDNGNWYIDNEDTGVSARGSEVYVGDDGHWYIDGEDTGIVAGAKPNAPPTADFSWSPDLLVLGDPIQFTDQSIDLDGFIASWEWKFGEITSTEQNPVFTFQSTGEHEISLTVTDNKGSTHTKTEYFMISLYRANRSEWSLKFCNSWQNMPNMTGSEGPPVYMWDGDLATHYHTSYSAPNPLYAGIPDVTRDPPPHTVVVDFGKAINVAQIEIYRRTGNADLRTVIAHVPAVADELLTEGDFEWLGNTSISFTGHQYFGNYSYTGVENNNWKILGGCDDFPSLVTPNVADKRIIDVSSEVVMSRYLKLLFTSYHVNHNISIAELYIITSD